MIFHSRKGKKKSWRRRKWAAAGGVLHRHFYFTVTCLFTLSLCLCCLPVCKEEEEARDEDPLLVVDIHQRSHQLTSSARNVNSRLLFPFKKKKVKFLWAVCVWYAATRRRRRRRWWLSGHTSLFSLFLFRVQKSNLLNKRLCVYLKEKEEKKKNTSSWLLLVYLHPCCSCFFFLFHWWDFSRVFVLTMTRTRHTRALVMRCLFIHRR